MSPRYAVMLRGINLGGRRRVAMAELRELLSEHGYGDVATHAQSGNVAVSCETGPAALAADVARLVRERFELEVPVVVRSGEELAAVLARDPLGDVASDPRRYQVSFCDRPVSEAVRETLRRRAGPGERVAFDGREIYAWHPDGIARSPLWTAIAGGGLGVTATARNLTTVRTLARMTASR